MPITPELQYQQIPQPQPQQYQDEDDDYEYLFEGERKSTFQKLKDKLFK